MLREVSVNLANNDISLNRCVIETAGFLQEMFKLGDPTPGCTWPYFILEDNIPEMTSVPICMADLDDNNYEFDQTCSSEPQQPQLQPQLQPQPGCSSSIPQTDYSQTTDLSIANSIAQLNDSSITNVCTSLLLSPDADAEYK